MSTTISDAFQRVGANLGPNWTNFLNGFTANNGAKATASGFNVAAYKSPSFPANQSSTIIIGTLNGATDFLYAVVFIQGTPTSNVNCIGVAANNAGLTLQTVVGASNASAGTVSNIGSFTHTISPGDTITLKATWAPNGTGGGIFLEVDYNGSSVITTTIGGVAAGGSSFVGGQPGIGQFGNVATIASFSGFTSPIPAAHNVMVCDGDSITSGFGVANPYTFYLTLPGGSNLWSINNVAIPGAALHTSNGTEPPLNTTAPFVVDPFFQSSLQNKICVIWAGTNDIALDGSTPAATLGFLQTYAAARKALGWKVIVVEPLSRVGQDANMQAYWADIQAAASSFDGLVSLPASLTATNAFSNSTFFQADGVHPTELSQQTLIAPAIQAEIMAIAPSGGSGYDFKYGFKF